MSQTVAITGISGLLGGNLAAACLARGLSVRGIVREQSKIGHLKQLGIDWHVAELSDQPSLETVFKGVSAVFHCAGCTVQSRWLRPEHEHGNIQAASTVLAAATAAGVGRLVHCSSTTTCGLSPDDRPVTETMGKAGAVTWFNDGYSRSKRAAEKLMLGAADQIDIVVVNPGFMLGPLDAKPSSGQLILSIAGGLVRGWPAGVNNFVDVRDVAAGMVLALERGVRGQHYILGGENLSYRQIMVLVARHLDIPPPRLAIPHGVARLAGWAGDAAELVSKTALDINSATVAYGYSGGMRFCSDKAIGELGYRPGPVGDGVNAAVAWFREHGMLKPPRPR